jgi:AraC-like DNA-binding protein
MVASPVWQLSLRGRPIVYRVEREVLEDQLSAATAASPMWWVILFTYHGEVVVEGRRLRVRPGFVGVFAPGPPVTIHFDDGRADHIYALFGLPSSDGGDVAIPCVSDVSDRLTWVSGLLERALAAWDTDPDAAARELFDLLRALSLRFSQERAATAPHPGVRDAVAFIESHLHEHLEVRTIVRQSGLSDSQLARPFRREFDTTVHGYVRRRRAELARRLLATTSLPAKTIAAEVGLPDLQRFNKLLRAELGASPRALRRTGAAGA